MRCPSCLNSDTKVLESRVSHEGRSVRRRRTCPACTHRFTTYEKEEDLIIQVQKRTFSVDSRTNSINVHTMACRKRQVTIDQIETLITGLEAELNPEGIRIVSSQQIGDFLMQRLRQMDHVAYVRFASIYRDFKRSRRVRAGAETPTGKDVMFTGLIETTGTVKSITPKGDMIVLEVVAKDTEFDSEHGASIAINGCCLTVTDFQKNKFSLTFLSRLSTD